MIPAGRSGKIVAKVHTKATQNAKLKKSISVITDAEKAKNFRLSMEFTVESAITIRPRAQIYFNGIVGKEQSTRLLFHSNDGKALKIEKIRFEDPVIKMKTETFDPEAAVPAGFKPGPGDVWLVAEILPEAKAGSRNTKAWITTSNAKAGEIEIPVNIRIRPLIEAHPAEVRLWVEADRAGPRSTTFRIANNEGRNFSVSSIEVADPGLFAASVLGPKPAQIQRISIKLLDGIGPAEIKKGVESKIVIHTSDPAQPLVTVPVRLMQRQAVTRPAGLQAKPAFNPRPLPTGTPRPYPTGTPHPG